MRNFYRYIYERSVVGQQRRIAYLMVEQGVDPYRHIQRYLDSQPINEGIFGNFFQRIGNAWRAFWKNPNPEDSPITRLETAKKALGELTQMIQQNQGAEADVLGTVLRGLEQSLTIINKVEPTIKDMAGRMQQFGQDGVAGNDPMYQLPDAHNQQWHQLMNELDAILKEPDSEQKLQKIAKNREKFLQFKQQLEDEYQKMAPDPNNQDKKRLENFLRRIDADASFREIEALMDFARRRAANSGMMVVKPQGYEEVIAAWRQIARTTRDENQQRAQLIAWYNKLPANHRIRQFIQGEMQNVPGKNEVDLFYDYAHGWINKYAHHLTGM